MRIVVPLLVLLLSGCVQPVSPALTAARIADTYSVENPFSIRTLRFQKDGSFSFYQLSKAKRLKTDPVTFEESWGVSRTWSFQPPDRIELVSASRLQRTSLRVTQDAAGRVDFADTEPLLRTLRHWLDAARLVGPHSTETPSARRTLRLEADGSFSYYELSKRGQDDHAESWAVNGKWSFHPRDRVELVSAAGTSRTTITVRVDAMNHIEVLEMDRLPVVLKPWASSTAPERTSK